MKKPPPPLEREEQIVFVNWLEEQKAEGKIFQFTSIPNSTYTTSWNQKSENFKMGLRRGLPDMLVVPATGCILFVEMKRLSGSTTSPEQKEWIDTINLCGNCEARICRGASAAETRLQRIRPQKELPPLRRAVAGRCL